MLLTTPFGTPWEPRFLSHVPAQTHFSDLSGGHKNDGNLNLLLYVHANIATSDFEAFCATRRYRPKLVFVQQLKNINTTHVFIACLSYQGANIQVPTLVF